jgi:ribonuclease P protein component
VRIETLQKRAEFQRVRGGGRFANQAFVLEGKARTSGQSHLTPRFGFTVTKKVGNAVVRNRIRRRLKAALSGIIRQHADPRFDYVVVARLPALDRPFIDLKSELQAAFRRVNGQPQKAETQKLGTSKG